MVIIKATYLWCGINGDLHTKIKIIKNISKRGIYNPHKYPKWDYDGSSCGQATVINSEVKIIPKVVKKDPFLNKTKNNSYIGVIILCESIDKNNKPVSGNYRTQADKIFKKYKSYYPWFGFELEFFLMKQDSLENINYHNRYYCSIGYQKAFYRDFMEEVVEKSCLIGIDVKGYNFEVAPKQAEIQVFGCGIKASDDYIFLKYIMALCSEKYNIYINYHPKPYLYRNGSGCHINFSTIYTRENGGYDIIDKYTNNLKKCHDETINNYYGKDNDKRLTGSNETCSFKNFKKGVGDRTASIRIPQKTYIEQKGYLEDRRPASNIDPYLASLWLFMKACNLN